MAISERSLGSFLYYKEGHKLNKYYFPVSLLLPDVDNVDVHSGCYSLVLRRWDVTVFDLATLQLHHRLHMPSELMTVFLRQSNFEFEILAGTVDEAKHEAHILKAMLYLHGCSPFILPFVSTYSVNEYAGINSRDSEYLKQKLPEEMKNGLTSENSTVEVWPFELTLQTIRQGNGLVEGSVFKQAVNDIEIWRELLEKFSVLKTLQDALITAPLISNIGQSILHIWTAIESIFPTVNQEVSFRIAIYLTQIYQGEMNKIEYFSQVKKAYGVRSKVAHGSSKPIKNGDWLKAWRLLIEICRSILLLRKLPSEEEIVNELFSGELPHRLTTG